MKKYGLIIAFYPNSTYDKRVEGTWTAHWLTVELALCECIVGKHRCRRYLSFVLGVPCLECPVLSPWHGSPSLPLVQDLLRDYCLREVFPCSFLPPHLNPKERLSCSKHPHSTLQGTLSTTWLYLCVIYAYLSSCCTSSSMKGGTVSVGSLVSEMAICFAASFRALRNNFPNNSLAPSKGSSA